MQLGLANQSKGIRLPLFLMPRSKESALHFRNKGKGDSALRASKETCMSCAVCRDTDWTPGHGPLAIGSCRSSYMPWRWRCDQTKVLCGHIWSDLKKQNPIHEHTINILIQSLAHNGNYPALIIAPHKQNENPSMYATPNQQMSVHHTDVSLQ